MAILAVLMLILAMSVHSSGTWCICKDGMGDSILQRTLDYACGAGADCNPVKQNGPCFQPNTVKAHCNYAVNSYFQRKGQSQGSCDFSGTATFSPSDPSTTGCVYPSSPSGAGTSTTMPSTGTPSRGTSSTNMPSTGVLGGIGNGNGNGVGPSGPGITTNDNSSGLTTVKITALSYISCHIFTAFVICLWA